MLGLDGVRGLTIAFSDNNGITRSRTVPFGKLDEAVERGVGITSLFPVFTSTDGITFAHEPLSTPSGDLRLCATADRVRQLAGQPAFAWTPGRLFEQDGTRSVYCQRGALERQVERAADAGLEVRAGFELEWFIGHADAELSPAHHGPVYGPLAMLEVNEFCTQLLADLDANGIVVGQLHAEYGLAQMELAISPADPLAAADMQLLTRQTIHAAARANGLRASFAPLVTPEAAGNGWHAHSSVLRDDTNLLAGGKHPHGLTAEGEAWLAGVVRELPALAAIAGAERPLAAAPPARLLRERVRLLGHPEPRGVAALHPRDRARARGGRERRAQGLGRFRQPLPHARRADLGRPRGHRRGPDPRRPDQRGSRLLG